MNSAYCKPKDLMITSIPVPPSCLRPTVQMMHGMRNEDDLTAKMSEIIVRNNELERVINEGEDPQRVMTDWYNLQCSVAQYFNSDVPGLPFEMSRQKKIRAFHQRLKGKEGRFRQNLLGKRVDYTGRTVISPDPNCAIDEVVVPQHMARILTYPERVNNLNIAFMKELVLAGADTHPGANLVTKLSDPNEEKVQHPLRYMGRNFRRKIADELQTGDVVERHLHNGDTVLFNRQPSLHRVSIMAHRARVMPFRTLRFNECVCKPYNADFDGDEMNIHLPQTEEA